MSDEDRLDIIPWFTAHEYPSWCSSHSIEQPESPDQSIEGAGWLYNAKAALLNGHIAVIVGGQDTPLVDSYAVAATLALFDIDTNHWMANFDVDGSLPRRIGHSVVTVDQHAYVFGGESLDELQPVPEDDTMTAPLIYDDMYRLSFAERVLQCERVGEAANASDAGVADASSGSATESIGPPARAWHASTAVTLSTASDTPESSTLTHGMVVLGGRSSSGAMLKDAWMLTVHSSSSSSWAALLPTGTSPLPLAYHQAVTVGDGSRVLVVGGARPSQESTTPLTMNHDIYILDLVANAWSTLALPSIPFDGSSSACLTGRCCATAVAVTIPVDHDSRYHIVRIVDAARREQCEPSAAILIFGGFSDTSPSLSPTSWLLLDPSSGSVEAMTVPNAGMSSVVGHATVASSDAKSLYVFGGLAVDDSDISELPTRRALTATIGLHFWRETPILQEEEAAAAKRKADANPIKTRTMKNGDVYVGEMDAAQELRHGSGKCTYHRSGDVYEGEWRKDQRSGLGIQKYSSGDVYSGEWQSDQRHGYGVLDYAHDQNDRSSGNPRRPERYEGDWKCDRQHGRGTLRLADGSQLIGDWENGSLRCDAISTLENFDDGVHGVCTYVGQIRDGVPHGRGESRHGKSQEVYVGEWSQGKRSGRGKATLLDGTEFDGEWRNGKRNGFGKCSYTRTRDRYDGKWVGDVRCGRGVCLFANGSRYDGEWKDDQSHGAGRYTFADGSFYDGEWRDNRFHGDGSFVLCMDVIHSQSTASLQSGRADA